MKGVSEDIQRRACKEVLAGLAEDGLAAGAEAGEGGQHARPASRVTAPEAVAPAASPLSSALSDSRRLARSGGKCGADVARGTRCKLCGEKH
jgi:hypothetical protein